MAIKPAAIRYIKLGEGGAWADDSFSKGLVQFGHKHAPHDMCERGDWEGVRQLLLIPGRSPSTATNFLREIRDFYTLSADGLWVTFAHDHLWWTFASPEVTWLGGDGFARPTRSRPCIDGWKNTDLQGRPLIASSLSSRLTRTGAYRATICKISCEEYLLQLINGSESPLAAKAKVARENLIGVAIELIGHLHWKDFEDLVDLIFSRSGWQRLSRVGESRATIDLDLQEPILNLSASAQVKSTAGQAELDAYVAESRKSGVHEHLFFVCHSPKGPLVVDDDSTVHVWDRNRVATLAVNAGLYDWIVDRAG